MESASMLACVVGFVQFPFKTGHRNTKFMAIPISRGQLSFNCICLPIRLIRSLTELTSVRNLGFIIDQELNMKDQNSEFANMIRSWLQFGLTFTGFRFRFAFDTSSTLSRATAWLDVHGVPDRVMPLRYWHSSKAQPSVVVPGSAPSPSISEETIREKRFLCLLTTAVELASCRHPTSLQRASTFPEETQNSLYATVHVMPLRIHVNSVNSTSNKVK